MLSKHSTSLKSSPCSYPQLISFHAKNWPFVPPLCFLSLHQFLIHDITFHPWIAKFLNSLLCGSLSKAFWELAGSLRRTVWLTLSRDSSWKKHERRRKTINCRQFSGWHVCFAVTFVSWIFLASSSRSDVWFILTCFSWQRSCSVCCLSAYLGGSGERPQVCIFRSQTRFSL